MNYFPGEYIARLGTNSASVMAGGQFDSLLLSLASLILIFLLAPNFVEEKIAREDIKHNQSRSLATQNLFRKNNFHFENNFLVEENFQRITKTSGRRKT
jgi:hypothetical protein